MRQRDLLAAIADIDSIRVQGTFERQAIGAAAYRFGLAGLIAPAASRCGETLALFSTNLPAGRWPKVTKRDIWRGLPPDPRRLRLVNEA